jgi:hypothetical protein
MPRERRLQLRRCVTPRLGCSGPAQAQGGLDQARLASVTLPEAIGMAPGLQGVVFGVVLIAFVLFEPMGIYGALKLQEEREIKRKEAQK